MQGGRHKSGSPACGVAGHRLAVSLTLFSQNFNKFN
jgi:hypothetical protein